MRREALGHWLTSLLSLRGEQVLRLKGVVHLAGEPRPVVLQAVHHVLHPLTWVPERAAAPGVSELVVIHRGLSQAGLQASFATTLG